MAGPQAKGFPYKHGQGKINSSNYTIIKVNSNKLFILFFIELLKVTN